jgi:hypothetical protein
MKENEYIADQNKQLPFKWIAIEVIKFNTFTLQSDLWSFGVTLWFVRKIISCQFVGKFSVLVSCHIRVCRMERQ